MDNERLNAIRDAVRSLDVDNDTHWTADGKPAMTAVEQAYGDNRITRADVDEAVGSEYTRAVARSAPKVVPTDTGDEAAPRPDGQTGPGVQPDPRDEEIAELRRQNDDLSAKLVMQTKNSLRPRRPAVTPKAVPMAGKYPAKLDDMPTLDDINKAGAG